MLAFDLETHRITPLDPFPKPIVLSWFDGINGGLVPQPAITDWILTKLADGESLCGHNLKFDLICALRESPAEHYDVIFEAFRQRRLRCTAQTEYLHLIKTVGDTFSSVALARLSEKYLNQALAKEDTYRLRYSELEGTPLDRWPAEAKEYALKDAEVTWRVGQAQVVEGTEPYRQSYSDFCLGLFSREHINIDLPYLRERISALDTEISKVRDDCVRNNLLRQEVAYSPRGPKAKKLGPPPLRTIENAKIVKGAIAAYTRNPLLTVSGDISRSALALRISGAGMLRQLGEYKKLAKAKSYAETYHSLGAEVCVGYNNLVGTGRVSSRKILRDAVAFNAQQVPRDYGLRGAFIAPQGRTLIQCDLAGAELRALAQICYARYGMSRMRDAFVSGQDLHSVMGATLLGGSYTDFQERLGAGDKQAKLARQLGKIANFSLAGLSGPGALVGQVRKLMPPEDWITETKAREIHSKFPVAWPELRYYFRDARQAAAKGSVASYRSNRVRRIERATQGANTPFQALVADIAKTAIRRVCEECFSTSGRLAGARPWLFVHDEIILAAPDELAAEYADELGDIMRVTMAQWLPDVPAVADPQVLGKRWRK